VFSDSPADVVRTLLASSGLASEPGTGAAWPAFVTKEPAAPDSCITVYNTRGSGDGRSHVDGELLARPGVQVRLRCSDPRVGWDKLTQVQTWMAKLLSVPVVVDASKYTVLSFVRIGDVLELGKETPTSMRSLFTLNALVNIVQEA
jgi:hypothetical protein